MIQARFVSSLKSDYREYVPCEFGIIDVIDKDTIYEVKPTLTLVSLKQAIGQLLCYRHSYPEHSMVVVFEDSKQSPEVTSLLMYMLKHLHIGMSIVSK